MSNGSMRPPKCKKNKSCSYKIDFVGTPPFLGIAIRVAIETMNIYIAQTGLFLRNIFFFHLGGPNEQFCTHEKLSCGGARWVNLDPGVYPPSMFLGEV